MLYMVMSGDAILAAEIENGLVDGASVCKMCVSRETAVDVGARSRRGNIGKATSLNGQLLSAEQRENTSSHRGVIG